MARHLDKDPATYNKERDGFIRDLQHFHDTRGTPFRRCPTLGGQEVDLYLLYSLVTQQGGWMKVNSRNEWSEIFEQFNLPAKCVNSGIALKQIYIRYLDRYEKVHFLGEEADRGSDDDEESRHKRWSARALHSVPLNYNYHQHNIADSTRAYNGLSTTLYKPSDYDRLALSLISPLPNEQDFAVNVCTLMCNEGKHTLRLDRCPRLLDYLLAHTGVFNHESLRKVFTEVYSKIRKHSLNHFWYDALESSDLIDLANENNFCEDNKKAANKTCNSPPYKWRTKNKIQQSSSPKANTSTEGKTNASKAGLPAQKCASEKEKCQDRVVLSDSDSDSELFASEQTITKGKGFKLKLEPTDRELFCTGRTLGTQDYVGQRILQIAHILRNLSFTEDNIPVLATNRTFLRFVLLCASSRWNSIHQLGLDMLSNIAGELTLKDQNERITECLVNFIVNGLHNQDRVVIIACLEILNKLSQRESNEEFMLRSLDRRAYEQVCSFLTLHDVMLLIYTLECLYSLSSLGERACNYIVGVHGIIDTLVSLVTVEGKSYGPKACIGMKLVETVPGTLNTPQTTNSIPSLQQSTTSAASSTTTNLTTTPARPTPASNAKSTLTTISKLATPQTSIQQQTQLQTVVSTTVNPQQFIQQQHAHQQAIQENEQFALAWLRATYEPCGHGRVEQQELYKQYLNSCAKIGRRGVIAPLHFPRCVRSVFGGTVGPNPLKNSDPPSNLLFYEGIRPRVVPLIITLPSAALQHTVHHTKVTTTAQRRKTLNIVAQQTNTLLVSTDQPTATLVENVAIPSPASPILKAQLSAPPKPRESPTKIDVKSQVLAHPHLSQALLGSSTSGKETGTTATTVVASSSTGSGGGQSSTSLIKSLLATKVNECMLPTHAASSMKTQAAVAPVAITAGAQDSGLQVAQRQQQQRLLAAQQNQQVQQSPSGLQSFTSVNKKVLPKPQPKSKVLRMNGIRITDVEANSSNENTSTSISENHYQPPPAAVISSVGTNSTFRGRREPPQPPPPPLAPLSTGSTNARAKTPRMDAEDSDSTGNNSLASSTGVSSSNIAVSSTEDGENSLTSFEGILLNGIPHSVDIDAPCNDDSNSKDSIRNVKSNKPLKLADLLEKKVEKDPPILNGIVCKELRISDRGLELVDNHINKILNKDSSNNAAVEVKKEVSVIVSSENSDVRTLDDINSVRNNEGQSQTELKTGIKRPADNDISDVEAKKRNVSNSPSVIVSNNLNGVDSPKPESLDSNGDEANANVSVSATAANLYASLAADVLEDEDEEMLLQQETTSVETESVIIDEVPVQTVQQTHVQQTQQQVQVVQGTPMQQIITVGPQPEPQLIVTTPRQIIVSQGQIQSAGQQVLLSASGQLTLQQNHPAGTIKAGGHQTMPMLVQTSSGTSTNNNSVVQQRPPVVLSQPGGAPIHLVSHGSQVQLVQASTSGSTSQPGQYVLQATPAGGSGTGNTHYVVTAQPQTALVQGTPQTVLVAQTPQQQGTPTKTIIILQPQAQTVTNTATHHQKVVVTPQGQQVVVTQVQRPILQSPTVTNNIPPALVSNSNAQIQVQGTSCSPIKSNQATVITQNTSTVTVVTSAPSPVFISSKERTLQPQTTITNITDSATIKIPNQTTSPQPLLPPPVVIKDFSNPYVCEWRGCTSTKRFKSANEVYMHACEAHCAAADSNPGDELQCLWDRCDTMKRKRFSLMTHLHDRHCSPEIMKAVAARRRQLSQTGKTEIPPPTPPPPHPGYAPDAALHAIKRHALEFVNPKELQQKNQVRSGTAAVPVRPGAQTTEQDDNEGPVTKSIRLTASLILRNLVIYSSNSRRYLKHYEPHLAGVALSNVESSRTIAQLLYDMNDTSTSRR